METELMFISVYLISQKYVLLIKDTFLIMIKIISNWVSPVKSTIESVTIDFILIVIYCYKQ